MPNRKKLQGKRMKQKKQEAQHMMSGSEMKPMPSGKAKPKGRK